jgi:hypothetical protein
MTNSLTKPLDEFDSLVFDPGTTLDKLHKWVLALGHSDPGYYPRGVEWHMTSCDLTCELVSRYFLANYDKHCPFLVRAAMGEKYDIELKKGKERYAFNQMIAGGKWRLFYVSAVGRRAHNFMIVKQYDVCALYQSWEGNYLITGGRCIRKFPFLKLLVLLSWLTTDSLVEKTVLFHGGSREPELQEVVEATWDPGTRYLIYSTEYSPSDARKSYTRLKDADSFKSKLKLFE